MKGEILGERYQVEQLLGKKAGRRTFLAHDLQSNQPVVIKLLTFSNDFEWDDLKLFEREAETLKALNHSAIPRYLDYFEISSDTVKGFALVQNYIEAKTLEQYLKSGRTFTEVEVKEIATSLLEILIYLHSQNPPVIHRDIKPSNILLSNRSGNSVGKVYLVDFGSVQTVAAKEGGTMTVVGTYGYMAPEQFGGRAVPASDIYSLGATLIYLVTGSHPADLPQVDLKIEFEDKANVSKEFIEWLKLMTAPSLNRRCNSPEEVLAILYKPISISNQLSPIIHPVESKIKINKTKEYIEVYMPPLGIKPIMLLISIVWNMTMYFCAMTFSNVIIEYGIEKLITLGILSVTAILTCLLAWVAVIWTIYMTTFLFFGQNYLKIDQNQICNYYKVFNRFKLTFFCSRPRTLIDKIVYIPKSTTYLIPPQLTIWASRHRFPIVNLSRDVIYSEREIEWLAYELSDWLGIPISHY